MRAYLYVALSFGRLPHHFHLWTSKMPTSWIVAHHGFSDCLCMSYVTWLLINIMTESSYCFCRCYRNSGCRFCMIICPDYELIICVFNYTQLCKLMKYYDCRCRYTLYIPTELVVPSPSVLKLWEFYASVFLVLWRLSLHRLTDNLAHDCWLLGPLVFSAIWEPV